MSSSRATAASRANAAPESRSAVGGLRVLAWLALLLALVSPAARGQDSSGEDAVLWDSPRAVLEAFLDGMVEYHDTGFERHRDQAVSTFDLSSFNTVFRKRAPELAEKLYQTFNRVEYVDLETLPGFGELQSSTHSETFGPPPGKSFQLHVQFVETPEGGWLISGETIGGIEADWEAVQDFPLLADLPVLTRLHSRVRASLPAAFVDKGFVLENWQWLGLLVLVFLAVVGDRVARFLVGVVLRRVARSEHVALDPDAVGQFAKPLGMLVGASVFGWLLPVLDLDPQILKPLDIAASFVATVAGVWAAYRLVDVFSGYLEEKAGRTASRVDDVLVPLVRRTLKILVVIVGLVYLASKWTEDFWGVVAGLGVGSLAIAFAARDTIENLFGTFAVLLDKPFELGDWVKVDDIEGTVEEVGFRSTRIRTFYNSVITVPNRTFVTAEVDNMGRRRYRRIRTTLALTYDTPPEKVEAFCAGVRAIIETHPYTRKDYFHVYLNAFGASSLDVLLYAFVETPDWGTELREKHRLYADILRLAERLGVSFAFPTQTLHVAKPEDHEHPDRPESDPAGAQRGVALGREIAEKTLEPFGGTGSVPPPVSTNVDPHDLRGAEADGEGG